MVKKFKIKFFDTERKAEKFLKKNRKEIKLKGFRPTVQGNAIVMIPRKTTKRKRKKR